MKAFPSALNGYRCISTVNCLITSASSCSQRNSFWQLFFPTQPGDAGIFTCVATNPAGSARRDVHLSINTRPVFKELPGDVTLNKGQSLALSCHAQGTPPPSISWTINNKPYRGTPFRCSHLVVVLVQESILGSNHNQALLGATTDEAGRSSVLSENVTLNDAGTYVCLAENSVGSIRALSFVRIRGEILLKDYLYFKLYMWVSHNLFVSCIKYLFCAPSEPPVLKGEAHTSQTVVQGGTAMLDCPVHGDPSPVLRWLRNGKPLHRLLRMQTLHNGSLVIYSITVIVFYFFYSAFYISLNPFS